MNGIVSPGINRPKQPGEDLQQAVELTHRERTSFLARLFPARTERLSSQRCLPHEDCNEQKAFHPL